jgi:SNF2 family DNA or RNA helicase
MSSDSIDASIALMLTRPSGDDRCKTTLVVAPKSLLNQWADEIQTRTDPPLQVYVHHAESRQEQVTSSEGLLGFDVVITTYGKIVIARPRRR